MPSHEGLIANAVKAIRLTVITVLVIATAAIAAGCGSSGGSDTSQHASESPPGLHYPSPPIGNSSAYEAAFNACNDGITAEGLCTCIAAKLSERSDAASLDYATLLDYNNPNPPGFLIDVTGYCEATP